MLVGGIIAAVGCSHSGSAAALLLPVALLEQSLGVLLLGVSLKLTDVRARWSKLLTKLLDASHVRLDVKIVAHGLNLGDARSINHIVI